MKIILIAVGTKMPAWVEAGFQEYIRRLPPEFTFELKELTPARRTHSTPAAKARELEGRAILEALPKKAHIIALDERGKEFSSLELGAKWTAWESMGENLVLLIGGPDGLTDECRNRADELWSLSRLTLPHTLVRVVLAECLYRAYSIARGLPYHRA